MEGIKLDLLRAKIQDGAGVRLGGLPAADLLPDPQALDGQVVGQAGLVQAPPAHLGQDGGVVLQADVEGRVMGGQPAGGAGLAHRHAALQGQHQRPGAGGQPRLANHAGPAPAAGRRGSAPARKPFDLILAGKGRSGKAGGFEAGQLLAQLFALGQDGDGVVGP